MKKFLERLAGLAKDALRGALRAIKTFRVWISPPPRLTAALLGLAFVVALASWSLWDGRAPTSSISPISRVRRSAASCVICRVVPAPNPGPKFSFSEFLLGPRDPWLASSLPANTRLASILLRGKTLYIDLGEEAALADRAGIEGSIAALRKTVLLGIHQVRKVVVTIGGEQPWVDGIAAKTAAPPSSRGGAGPVSGG